jgi:hypothetical protein
MLFLKNTLATVAIGVFQVDVAAMPPGKTFDIFVASDEENLPQAFIDSIEGMGFTRAKSSSYTHSDGKKVLDLHFQKPGTDIFQGWSNAERELNLQLIERVLADFGIKTTPRVMTISEAFH